MTSIDRHFSMFRWLAHERKPLKAACHIQKLRKVHNVRAIGLPALMLGEHLTGEQVDEVSSRRRTQDRVRPGGQFAAQPLRCGRWETELRAVQDAWRCQIANP
jgi:hypothetical protein